MKKIFLFSCIIFLFLAYTMSVNAYVCEDINVLKRNDTIVKLAKNIETILLEDSQSFPSYFGGMFISDDKSKLVLLIVKEKIPSNNSKEYATYNDIVTISENVEIRYVKNSYSYLEEIYNFINSYYKDVDYVVSDADFSNYAAHYIDVKNNSVVVDLHNYNDNTYIKLETLTDEFKKKVIDSDAIIYELSGALIDETSIYASQAISANGQSNACSMGYRVKINNNPGYITAAHCFSGLWSSATGGTVTRYKFGGKVDAAFVQTTSLYTPLNTLLYPGGGVSTLNNSMSPTLVVGGTIAHSGFVTGYSSGTILSLNYSGNFSNVLFTNLISANYTSAIGDSGGPAFVPTANNGGLVAGIHKGSAGITTKIIVNADYILAEFNYVRY